MKDLSLWQISPISPVLGLTAEVQGGKITLEPDSNETQDSWLFL